MANATSNTSQEGGRFIRELRENGINRHTKKSLIQADIELETHRIAQKRARESGLSVEEARGIGEGNLSKYEIGKLNPQPETLELILDALASLKREPLRFNVRRDAFKAFGYAIIYYRPTDVDRQLAAADFETRIQQHPFPAYLLDNSITMACFNQHVQRITGFKKGSAQEQALLTMPLYQAFYHPDLRIVDSIMNPDAFLPAIFSALRQEYALSGYASWFERQIEEARQYDGFTERFEVSDQRVDATNQSLSPIRLRTHDGIELDFWITIIMGELDTRFRLLQFSPANQETYALCNSDAYIKGLRPRTGFAA